MKIDLSYRSIFILETTELGALQVGYLTPRVLQKLSKYYRKIKNVSPIAMVRNLASSTLFYQNMQLKQNIINENLKISKDDVNLLTECELESFADFYIKNDNWLIETNLQKEEEESPIEHLYRIILHLIKKEEERIRKTYKKIGLIPNENINKILNMSFIKILDEQIKIEKMIMNPVLELNKHLTSSYLSSVPRIHQEIDQMLRVPLDEYRKLEDLWSQKMDEMIIGPIKAIKKSALFSNALENTFDSVLVQMENMMRSPIEEIKKSIEHTLLFDDSLKTIKKGLSILQDFALSLPQDSLIINADATLNYADSTYNLVEVQNLINDSLPEGHFAVKADKFDDAIEKIVKAIYESSKEPIVQKIILKFIIPFIISLITLFLSLYMNEISKNYNIGQKKHVTRNIQKNFSRLEFEKEFILNYRMVTADFLNVREKPNGRSKKIGMLHFGQVVNIIEKRKDWILVEIANAENEVKIRGWVFARYLKKLIK